jgi:hypothetical protein
MELQDPRQPERIRVLQMISGYQVSRAVYVLAKLGIPDLLAAGPLSLSELAQRTETDAPSLGRVLRALCGVGLVADDGHGTYALCPAGEMLRSDVPGSLRALSVSHGEEQYLAWNEVLHTVKTGETAFARKFGKPLFEHLAEHPDAAECFNRAMSDLVELRWRDILPRFDFSQSRRIVDVGGGDGALLAAILREHPAIEGELYDSEQGLIRAPEVLKRAGVEQRCKMTPGDFFESVPADADTYILSCVLFDWDDKECIRILRNIRRASSRARLLIYETAMPEGNSLYFGKFFDLNMMVVTGGRVRREVEHQRLLTESGFELVRTAWANYGTVFEAHAR